MDKMNRCLNIIVYYDNCDEVINYLKDIQSTKSYNVDVAIVINSDLKKEFHLVESYVLGKVILKVMYFDYGKNIGYLNSMLKVIEEVEVDDYSYFILSNTDIHYVTHKFYEVLVRKKYNESIGCIAPSVFSKKTNSYSNPHYIERINQSKFKRLLWIFGHPFIARGYLWLSEKKAQKKKDKKRNSCYVYSPHGCFMIFSKNFIKSISGYYYGAEMYSEESCVGELILQKDKKCFYDSTLEVEHCESSVTGKINYKKRFNMWRKSIKYILDTYYSE